ncbi:LysR substrate-binding domain-containing protein [Mesorhizobium sp. M0955]|uniref:LysR family transcriptional regulator n=1 Tax=Mesorhizobium sp. M0955 TaxID=2957033 RepID=UPI00333829C7
MPPPSLEIRELRAFVAVAEELSFVGAAKRLNIAQPALSRTISAIEAKLGVQLLDRTTRSARLTQAGTVFLLEARHTLSQMKRTVQLTLEAEVGLTGELRVGYMDFAIHGPMIAILAELKRTHPLLKLTMRNERSDDQSTDLAANRLDIGFAVRHRFRDDVEVTTLTREPLVLVMSESHRLAGLESISLHDLAKEPFVLGDRQGWELFLPTVEAFCGTAGFMPKTVLDAQEGAPLFKMVAAGIGVTVYPSCIRTAGYPGLVVKDFLEDAPVVETYFLTRRTGRSTLVSDVVAFVHELLSEGSPSH